jgi:hypothetical protein
LRECRATLLVIDFSPLREVGRCKEEICKWVSDSMTIHEVDTHNVVPTWMALEKMEFSTKIKDSVFGIMVDEGHFGEELHISDHMCHT